MLAWYFGLEGGCLCGGRNLWEHRPLFKEIRYPVWQGMWHYHHYMSENPSHHHYTFTFLALQWISSEVCKAISFASCVQWGGNWYSVLAGVSNMTLVFVKLGLKKDRRINWGKKTFYWNLTILINFLDFQILHSQIHCPIGSYICVNTKCEVKDGWIMAKLICLGGRYYDGLRQIQGQQNCKKKNIRLISSHLNQTSLKEVIIWPRELFSCGKNILCGQHRPTCLLK